ncbi:MAG: PT domain-containing protein, partial [Candidatus Pacebacteria bacterium]|nr:PT domain-containing protein [Candidatus Paceibacterota bacterium]
MVELCLPIIPDLAQMTSMKEDDVKVGLAELFRRKIPDISEGGLIYSKRMVRDEKVRQVRAESGKKGGNPQLLKAKQDGMSQDLLNQNPTKWPTKGPTNDPTKGPTNDPTKAPTKAPSKIQPLHLQSSYKENIKEPPISPHDGSAPDLALSDTEPPPQPPGGG